MTDQPLRHPAGTQIGGQFTVKTVRTLDDAAKAFGLRPAASSSDATVTKPVTEKK